MGNDNDVYFLFRIDLDKLLHREENRNFTADFPIGHFNAEEATQQIKNAVGVILFLDFSLMQRGRVKMYHNNY